jgi:5'-phosphate synthase pdxT subunit
MKVGVLALQGDVPEHLRALARVMPERSLVPVRRGADLDGLDALFLPGGESTTIARLLAESGVWVRLAERISAGLPVLGTCAGLILLSREIVASEAGRAPPTFGVLDVRVQRNGYGTQRESFESPVRIAGIPGPPFPGVFIRAPRILLMGKGVRPIAWCGTEVVGVRSGGAWGLSFHPELSGDVRLHREFLRATVRTH